MRLEPIPDTPQGSQLRELKSAWTDWRMANMGVNKYRFCKKCKRWEWV